MPHAVPIQEYEPKVPVEEGLRRIIPHVSGVNLGGETEQLGGALETVARGDAARYTMDVASRSQEQWLAHLKQMQESAPAGAPGFTGQVMDDYGKYMRETMKAAPNRLTQRMLQPHLSELGLHLQNQAMGFEAASRKEHSITTAQQSAERGANVVMNDSREYDNQLAQQVGGINALNVDGDEKEKLALHAKAVLSHAAVMHDIQ